MGSRSSQIFPGGRHIPQSLGSVVTATSCHVGHKDTRWIVVRFLGAGGVWIHEWHLVVINFHSLFVPSWRQLFSNFNVHQNHLDSLVKSTSLGTTPTASESAGLGAGAWGVLGGWEWWRICICPKFPSDNDAAGLVTTPWEPLPWSPLLPWPPVKEQRFWGPHQPGEPDCPGRGLGLVLLTRV